MGNIVSRDSSEDEELMHLLAIQLETDDFLFNEILQEENSIGEQDSTEGQSQKRTRMVYDRPNYKKSNWWKMLEKGDWDYNPES
jgi:hypothetical protein